MLSCPLKWYYEPLRLPIWPHAFSFPYTRGFAPPFCASIPGLQRYRCSSSTTCRSCYPGRLQEPFPFYSLLLIGLPHMTTASASPFNLRGYIRIHFHCGLSFSLRELTTPDYSDAALEHYQGARTTPRAELKSARPTPVAAYGQRLTFRSSFKERTLRL